MAAKTILGFKSRIQRQCPKGHSRWKHGLHSNFKFKIFTRSPSGGVNSVLVEPYIATKGRCKAAPICISPESFVTITLAKESKSIASAKLVLPVKSTQA